MKKWALLILGILVCTYDAFIPQETVLSCIGIACCFVGLRLIYKDKE